MKTSHSLYLKLSAVALALTFGFYAHAAEGPREELAHAYYLLKTAKADYHGHRKAALEEVGAAGRELGIELKGGAPEGERQWESDRQIKEARRLLADVRDRMEAHDRDRIAHHLEVSIKEVDKALEVK